MNKFVFDIKLLVQTTQMPLARTGRCPSPKNVVTDLSRLTLVRSCT